MAFLKPPLAHTRLARDQVGGSPEVGTSEAEQVRRPERSQVLDPGNKQTRDPTNPVLP